ncbi:MAG: hypothetical protein JKX68_12845, partial [Flavobacteriales bacterium]|nr:hypothetical protein [Flavobacteriales bacterium]
KLEDKRKAKQADHYALKHAGTTSVSSKKKHKKIIEAKEEKVEVQVQEEKEKEVVAQLSGFQKFIKWLNT